MIQLQNYITNSQKHTLMDTFISHLQKEKKIFIKGYDYSIWIKKNQLIKKNLLMHQHYHHQKVLKKSKKRIKKLNSKQIISQTAQVKVGNNSYKLKNKIRQILYLLYQHNKVIVIMEDNKIVKDPKIFYFHFDLPKDIDENLKHEIEFIMKNKNRN